MNLMTGRAAPRLIARLVFAASVVSPLRPVQGILEQIVVMVNGDVITKTEIDERLMMQRADELGLDVGDEDVDRVLVTIRAESRVDTDAAFNELLDREGMSLATLRATTRRRLLIEQVRQRLVGRLSVPDNEALRYYDTHRPEFTSQATVRFREVRIAVPRQGVVPDSERDRALMKVVRVGDRLAAGAEFATVAGAFSESASQASGGLVGPVEPGALEPSVRAALKLLRPGAISAPVETSAGYCFLKMEGMDAAAAPTFHESRERIVEMLLAVKQRAALEDLVGRLRGAALLQWKRRDLQAAYERPSGYR